MRRQLAPREAAYESCYRTNSSFSRRSDSSYILGHDGHGFAISGVACISQSEKHISQMKIIENVMMLDTLSMLRGAIATQGWAERPETTWD